ncbi:MAG: restriction endonuclease [Acidilobaceae archaeon]
MGRVSVDLGKSLEDLVELWLSRRGYAYERNVLLESPLGKFEADFLIHDDRGRVLVEVKNVKEPVDRDVVLKVYNASLAIAAYKAIIISSSGFTETARNLARLLERVELLELRDLLAELDAGVLDVSAQFLDSQITLYQAREWIAKHVVQKKFLVIAAEHVAEVEPIYYPVYLMKVRLALDQAKTRFRETLMAASAVSGLPLALDRSRKALYDALRELVDMPPDLLEVYRIYAGRAVARSELVQLYGPTLWNKLMKSLTARGLVKQLSSRPMVVEIANVLPGSSELEEAAKLLAEARRVDKPRQGFSVKEQLVSVGSIRSFLNQSLGVDVIAYTVIHAPFYRARLEERSGSYRIACITGWLKDPIVYLSCS